MRDQRRRRQEAPRAAPPRPEVQVSRVVVHYERERPGELRCLDVKKLGTSAGRRQAVRAGLCRDRQRPEGKGGDGHGCVHVAVDDHSRYAAPRRCRTSGARPPPPSPGGRSPASPASASGPGAHRQRRELPAPLSARRRRSTEWDCSGRGPTGRRPTARPQGLRQDPAGRVGVPAALRPERGAPRRSPGLPPGVRSRPSARRHRRGRPRLSPVTTSLGFCS